MTGKTYRVFGIITFVTSPIKVKTDLVQFLHFGGTQFIFKKQTTLFGTPFCRRDGITTNSGGYTTVALGFEKVRNPLLVFAPFNHLVPIGTLGRHPYKVKKFQLRNDVRFDLVFQTSKTQIHDRNAEAHFVVSGN